MNPNESDIGRLSLSGVGIKHVSELNPFMCIPRCRLSASFFA